MGMVADSGRMARPLRIHVSDGWYPIMSRETGVETVFRRDEDRRRFMGVCEIPRWRALSGLFVLGDCLSRGACPGLALDRPVGARPSSPCRVGFMGRENLQ